MSDAKQKILVTGAHRSGSTWIGKTISVSSKVRYVHEPFNLDRGTQNPPLDYWFEYITKATPREKQQKMLSFLSTFVRWNSLKGLAPHRSKKGWKGTLLEMKARMSRRTLFKDPIALFSAQWLYEQLDCKVIISVRHPAAFVASLKVKHWEFPFQDFLNQKELMGGPLQSYSEMIKEYSERPPDIILQGVLLWNCLYSMVVDYKEVYENQWHFVTHEALSMDPEAEFRKIFSYLELSWETAVSEKIQESTTNNQSTEHLRDAKANIYSWKERLTPVEIEQIKSGTTSVWKHFYTEAHW